MNKLAWSLPLLLGCFLSAGCGQSQAQPGAQPPPEVQVSYPITRTVSDYEDFPGRIEAVNSIDIRAHVTGYLQKVNFMDGAEVKEGEVLFEIDPRQYDAELKRADATFYQAEVRRQRLDRDFQRGVLLVPQNAIGREEFDRISSDRAEALAALGIAKASRDLAQLYLSYCTIRASISGRISRRNIDPGNLVKADDTVLTTVVSLDPIYAYFDLDERTTLRLQRLVREGKIKWSMDAGFPLCVSWNPMLWLPIAVYDGKLVPVDRVGLPVYLGLADEDNFPRKGVINFADNRVDSDTGTWRLRGRFDNRDRALSPGLFAHIRLPVGRPYKAVLVCEQALGTDQGQKFVYVVDDQGQVSSRRIKVGRVHNGLRVIEDGLKLGEKVVVSGLQRVRAGVKVTPTVVEMPVLGAPGDDATPPAKDAKATAQESKAPAGPAGGDKK
jgi:RND family efflux transporter MFP subunit